MPLKYLKTQYDRSFIGKLPWKGAKFELFLKLVASVISFSPYQFTGVVKTPSSI